MRTVNEYSEVKRLIDEESAYIRYLGEPKIKGSSLWWCSPFRSEKQASMCFTRGRGLHDFGTGKHYDVISLVAELYNVEPHKALDLVKGDYGIANANPYETNEIRLKIENRRRYEKEYRQAIKNDFSTLYGAISDTWKEWEKIRDIFKGKIELEAYKIALDKTEYLNYLLEEMRGCRTDNDKAKFLREGIKL